MANGQYIGVNGVARKVVTPYIGVDCVARKVTAGYVGVNGVARLFFAPDDGGNVVLEVEKITSDTYAGETTYTGEQFILLDIYPKTNGTVTVTYGGLTKTITDTSGAEEPNAQQVYFGTFNGVSDSVETPASGKLTIEGDYVAFGSSMFYKTNKSTSAYICSCITGVTSLGVVQHIPDNAFGYFSMTSLPKLQNIDIPNSVTRIGKYAFYQCNDLTIVEIPDSVKSIGAISFQINAECHRTVRMKSTHPPTLELGGTGEYNQFTPIGTHTIVVPKGCGNTYKTAEGWSTYADYIEEAS